MSHLLPSLRDGRIDEGILVRIPDVCYACHLKGREGCCKSKRIGIIQQCRFGTAFYRKTSTGGCYLGINNIPFLLGQEALDEVVRHDQCVVETERTFSTLRCSSSSYDEKLKRLRLALRPWIKQADYSLPHGTTFRVVEGEVRAVRDLVDCLRALTTEANDLVNSPDSTRLSIPTAIEEGLERIIDGGGNVGQRDGCVPLKMVLSQYRDTIDIYKNGVAAFNEWVHDVGHYMVRIDNALPTVDQAEICVDAVRSLDALTTELVLLKIDLMEQLGVSFSPVKLHSGKKSRWYEPYKVFHKHRYCYAESALKWCKGGIEFRRRAKTVGGVDFIAMNLYSNAVKYIKKYPGEKSIKTDFVQCPEGVEICVESYGPLVTVDELQKLGFASGTRAAAAKSYRGAGRGLLRVRKVCEKAGYKVWFTSEKAYSCHRDFALFGAHILIPENCFQDAKC